MTLSDKELLRKYINGNCTPEELTRVKILLAKPGYSEMLDELLSEDGNPVIADHQAGDAQMQGWTNKISRKIAEDNQQRITPVIRKPYFFRYAAIWIVFALGAGVWGISYLKKAKEPATIAYTEIFNPNGKRTKILLSDSSAVYLGAGSKLRFPERFPDSTREISLEGEAFFEIAHNRKKPFIVHTADIQTKVLGTSFKITAFKGHPLAVEVATGKVRVDRLIAKKLQSLAVLTPGQQVIYTNGKTQNTTVTVDDLKEWKEGHLIHTEKPLRFIAEELERWYNVKITIASPKKADMLMDINITANIPINRVMKVLSASGNFKYQINGSEITIR